jgi:hypothetical protein
MQNDTKSADEILQGPENIFPHHNKHKVTVFGSSIVILLLTLTINLYSKSLKKLASPFIKTDPTYSISNICYKDLKISPCCNPKGVGHP